MKARLDSSKPNAAIVSLGSADLFFSYGELIAVRGLGPAYIKAFNPDFRGFSATTTKHAAAMGCKGFPDSPSRAEFDLCVAAVLQHAGSN